MTNKTDKKLALGPFDLDRPIGQGGMGEVWLGMHCLEKQPVAIKVITSKLDMNEAYHVAFEREVHAAASMLHRGIVQVFDHGQIPSYLEEKTKGQLQTSSPYLVMEWANGGSLESHWPNNWPALKHMIFGILSALAHAHAKGMVHLDIKPANVLIQRQEAQEIRYQLSDFGIAYAFSSQTQQEDSAQRDGTIMGTPNYMSPEQFLGRWRAFGPWSDLYALGCMIFELLHGSTPFDAPSLLGLATSHLMEDPPKLIPTYDVPEGFDMWLARMMSKAPHQRFQCAGDAIYALEMIEQTQLNDDEQMEEIEAVYVTQPTAHQFSLHGNTQTVILDELQHTDDIAFGETLESTRATNPLSLHTLSKEDPWENFETVDVQPPPCPSTWVIKDHTSRNTLFGTGLGIWGIKALPLIGRTQQRQILWQHLQTTHTTTQAQMVCLTGPTGHGKSHISRWLREYAQEHGVATVLEVGHHAQAGYQDGLRAMLLTHTRSTGLNWGQTYRRIRRQIERLAPSLDASTLNRQASALAHWMHPEHEDSDEVPAVHFATEHERFEAICTWMRHLSRQRTLLFVIEDVHYNRESWAFLQYCMHALKDDAVMMVYTTNPDLIRPLTWQTEILESMHSDQLSDTIELGPLDRDEHEHLVGGLLGLAPREVQRVCDWTEGDPLFAIQLVEDWIQRNVLMLSAEGFCLDEEATITVPDGVAYICQQRLDRVVEAYHTDPEGSWTSLELAATLGEDVQQNEWHAVCASANVLADERLVGQLVQKGIAQRTQQGWCFNNRMFVDQLRSRAKHHNKHANHHLLCAQHLIHQDRERAGYHYLYGGHLDLALDTLLALVAKDSIMRDRRIIHDIESALELDQSEQAQQRKDRLSLKGHLPILIHQGDLEQAHQLLDGIMTRLQPQQIDLRIDAAIIGAKLCLYDQTFERGQAYLNMGQKLLNAHQPDDFKRQGLAWRYRAELEQFSGDPKTAEEFILRAITYFEQGAHHRAHAWAKFVLGSCMIDVGNFDASEQITRACMAQMSALGDNAGIIACEDILAIIAYEQGRYTDALENFEHTIKLNESIGDAGVWIAKENRARCLIKLDRFEEALTQLKAIRLHTQNLKANVFVNYISDAILACYAGLRNKDAWQSEYLKALGALHNDAHIDDILVEMLIESLQFTVDAGWTTQSQALAQVILELCETLDLQELANYTHETMAPLDKVSE